MSKAMRQPAECDVAPLSIEQLEAGLRVMSRRDPNLGAFWDKNIRAFRQTVLLAIRETSAALLSPTVPLHWQAELEGQLEELLQYFELANRYIARRSVSRARPDPAFPSSPQPIH